MELARKALKAGKYKSALDLARGAENYDASKKAEVNAFIDQVFVAIEGKRVEAEEQRQKAELQRQKAEEAERQAKISRKIADEEQQKSEIARIEALEQKEIAEKLLDSLGKFSNRDEALRKFNIYKDKGDILIANRQWDSADVCLRLALDIADANPLIQVGKKEIINQIGICATHISNRKISIEEAEKGDSVLNLGGIENYFKSYNIYEKITPGYIKNINEKFLRIIDSVNKCLQSEDTTCVKPHDSFALRYFLLELYTSQNNKLVADSMFSEMKKVLKAEIRSVEKVYRNNSFTMKHPDLYDRLIENEFWSFLKNVKYINLAGFRVEGSLGGTAKSTFLGSNTAYQRGVVKGVRIGYELPRLIPIVFRKGSARTGMTLSYSLELDYKTYTSKNTFFDTLNYFNNSNLIVLQNVKKWSLVNTDRFSFIGKSRIKFPRGKPVSMQSALPRILRGRGFAAGIGVKYTYIREKFDKLRNNVFFDTTKITSSQISSSTVTSISLPQYRSSFSVIGYEVELLYTFGRPIVKEPWGLPPIYGLFSFGFRYSNDLRFSFSKNRGFYNELMRNYNIVAGNSVGIFECFLSINLGEDRNYSTFYKPLRSDPMRF